MQHMAAPYFIYFILFYTFLLLLLLLKQATFDVSENCARAVQPCKWLILFWDDAQQRANIKEYCAKCHFKKRKMCFSLQTARVRFFFLLHFSVRPFCRTRYLCLWCWMLGKKNMRQSRFFFISGQTAKRRKVTWWHSRENASWITLVERVSID